MVAACVALPLDRPEVLRRLHGLRESKQLSSAARERWLAQLRSLPGVSIGVGWATVAEIERWNILRATHRAMERAVRRVSPPPDSLLVDGRPVPGLPYPSRAIVGGDRTCLSIAAASIVAKAVRDRFMIALDRRYPGYGLAKHKGYGTPAHAQALAQLGPSPCHRKRFRPVLELATPSLFNSMPIRHR